MLLGKGAVFARRFERPLAVEMDESEQRRGSSRAVALAPFAQTRAQSLGGVAAGLEISMREGSAPRSS
jgi:hypothetical protein